MDVNQNQGFSITDESECTVIRFHRDLELSEFEAYREGGVYQTRIFRDEEEALDWFGEDGEAIPI